MCKSDKMKCVKETTILDEKCLKNCAGLYVTSYFKSKMEWESVADFWAEVRDDYNNFKGLRAVTFPGKLKG